MLPSSRTAIAVHSDAVSGKARCGWPFEITRAVKSMLPARSVSLFRVAASAGGLTNANIGHGRDGRGLGGITGNPHRERRLDAYRRQLCENFRGGVQRIGQFCTGQADIGRPHEGAGIGGIHHADIDRADARDIETVDDVAGRQKHTGGGATGIKEIELDRCAGAGDAGNAQRAIVARATFDAGEMSHG